jgi:hypothetical protein
MKILLIFISTLLITSLIYSQNNYSQGYKEGFPIGYCYNQSIGCIAPITPIVPIPNIGESYNNFLDGYNRGLLDGIKNYNSNQSSTNYKKPTNNLTPYSSPQKIPDFKPFTPDLDFYQKIMSNKQSELNSQVNTQKKIIDPELDKFLKDYSSTEKIELRKQYIKFCKSQYSSFTKFPIYFRNGVYKASIISEPPIGNETPYPTIKENCSVLVQDNKIIAINYTDLFGKKTWIYFRDFFPSIQFKEYDEYIEQNFMIEKGKTKYLWNIINGYKLNSIKPQFFEVYFNEYIGQYNITQNLLTQVKQSYKTKKVFEKISDGWHTCYLTNNEDLCTLRNVYIENGKVVKWIGQNGIENLIESGGDIINCKSTFSKHFLPNFCQNVHMKNSLEKHLYLY